MLIIPSTSGCGHRRVNSLKTNNLEKTALIKNSIDLFYINLIIPYFGNPYDPAFLLLISPNSIKCLTIKEIREGILINKSTNNHLTLREEFEFSDEDKNIIERFIEKIGKISNGSS